jgi:Flp pilus assembly pilin Flp
MSRFLKAFAADRSGATSIEYGAIAVLISVGILVPLAAISDSVSGLFDLIMKAF